MTIHTIPVPLGENGEKDLNDYRNDPERVKKIMNLDAHKPEQPEPEATETDPLDWLSEFEMTDEEADELADPEWIVENMIIAGHMAAFCAQGNGGKSTIIIHLCPEMVSKGYTVAYVHVDCPADEARRVRAHAKKHGYRLLTPDFKKTGVSALDVMEKLRQMNESGADLTGTVFVFDTLKKFTDLMHKRESKVFYSLMRSLCSKGMTCIFLAHTNKHPGIDGKQVFEGVGDLRNDCDELIYFDSEKDIDTRIQTVSTRPDKVRGAFVPITYEIDADRNVKQVGHVDIQAKVKAENAFADDERCIELCKLAMQTKQCTQIGIADWVNQRSKDENEEDGMPTIGKKKVKSVLRTYSTGERQQWYCQRPMGKNNSWNYSIEPF